MYWYVRFIVVVALMFLSVSCQRNNEAEQTQSDSSFINSAYAQTSDEQLQQNSDELYNSRQNAITRAVAKVSPAVVGINVTQVQRYLRKNPFYSDPFWGQLFPELYRDRIYERKIQSLGSGFLISEEGYIITNQHVVDNAAEILVTMTDGRQFTAELIGEDRLTDIALLKIPGNNFSFIEFGHSDDLLVGEWVIALGNPFGLFQLNDQPTVTVGVISAIDRDWGRTEDGRLYLDMIQTDAAINHGNSGGPLVNSVGQVIGMNTFIFTGSQYQEGFIGIGFAIPVDRINEVVNEIRRKGSINREYWIGIYDIRALNPRIVTALKLKIKEGVIITQLDPDGPAFKMGLREYDIVVEVENKAVKTPRDFLTVLNSLDLRVGSTVRMKAVRDEQRLTFDVRLEPLPESMK
jgi:serine protease Do